MIESLGDDGVGSSVGVEVGSGVCVAVAVEDVEGDPLLEEQAVTKNSTTSKMGNDFFIGVWIPSNSNT